MRPLKAFLACVTAAALSLLPTYCNAFDSDALLRLVREKRITSVERLLEFVPLTLLSRYALVFDSRSLQGASFRDPRVILFGQDGKLVLTFNGNPDHRGYDAIEMMAFDSREKRFEFREIIFPGKHDPSGQVRVSEPNPEKCAACHGNPARPVWDAQPSWPGVYGQTYRAPPTREELAGLATFLENQATHPRYRALRNTNVFSDRNVLYPSAKFLYDGVEKEPPNAILSTLLDEMNLQSVVHEVVSSPRFPAYQYALLAALSAACAPLDAYFEGGSGNARAADVEAFSLLATRRNGEYAAAKRLRMAGVSDSRTGSSSGEQESLSLFRYLVESGLGISTRNWTMALEKGAHDFTSLKPVRSALRAQLTEAIAKSDSSITGVVSLLDVGAEQKYCGQMRKKSRLASRAIEVRGDAVAFAETRQPQAVANVQAPHPAVLGCINCHREGVGPPIAFDEPGRLAPQLRAGTHPRGTLLSEILFRLSPVAGQQRMPPNTILSAEERSALARYFGALAGN